MEVHGDGNTMSAAAKRERRKIQNRLNKRALRRREAKAKEAKQDCNAISKDRPYWIGRWRVDVPDIQPHLQAPSRHLNEVFISHACLKTSEELVEQTITDLCLYPSDHLEISRAHRPNTLLALPQIPTEVLLLPALLGPGDAIRQRIRYYLAQGGRHNTFTELSSCCFPLSSDHLLPLIHHNVLRAIAANKSLVIETTSLVKAPQYTTPLSATEAFDNCDGLTLLYPRTDTPSPDSLHPTPSQMRNPHYSWLNYFPFPRLRDNLIESQEAVDVWDLCYDLLGEMIVNYTHSSPQSTSCSTTTSISIDGDSEAYSDDVSARRCCLIVWGDAWDERNWEITPGFLRKWAWLLQGCDSLVESSNCWRAKRGEEPLQLEVYRGMQLISTNQTEVVTEIATLVDWHDSINFLFSSRST